ncbi:MAG: head-tail adaptor protein [Pseudomonadota bacterium]
MSMQMSRKLTLEERLGGSDGAGGKLGGWTALGVHWGHVEARTGRFETGEGYPRSRVPYRIIIRAVAPDAPSRPKAGQRFREGNRIYRIRSVADQGERLRYLVCLADEEVAA